MLSEVREHRRREEAARSDVGALVEAVGEKEAAHVLSLENVRLKAALETAQAVAYGVAEQVRDDEAADLGDRMIGKGASFQAGEILRVFWAEGEG